MKNIIFSLNLFTGFNMKKYFVYLMLISTFLFVFAGCKAGANDPETVDQYAQKISDGWTAFSQGNFSSAKSLFTEARISDSTKTDAYLGIAWCFLKLDSLENAVTHFNVASKMGLTNADLNAGYAFALNASKQYQMSNTQAAIALNLSPNWVFAYQTSLNKSDLQLLQAQNYYQLGDFTNSLTFVRLINVAFSSDVSTAAGRLALADEIERLKNTL